MNPHEQKFYLTQEGIQRIQQEYKSLTELKRTKLQEAGPERVRYTDEPDPECLSFQEELEEYNSRLATYEIILKNAVPIAAPRTQDAKRIVGLGAKVMVRVNRSVHVLTIVGPLEADPSSGKISNECPVGKALLGRRMGETIMFGTPEKTIYKVIKIIY
ncbi:MAG: GreA/GreB family elongation factor [Candidatus Yanofskybacteria bacterium]|nr:GreA/GreB family elongation factor [Candidatus Yanofskybacteria bacterium]